MQKPNKITALFFLGLFSLMILHQAFPHLHHQHEDSNSPSHSDVAHSGEHHHDNNSQENGDSTYGFFDFFMDMHVHSTVSSDIIILKRNTLERQTAVDRDVADIPFDAQNLFLLDIRKSDGPPIYHPPNKYFNPYLFYLDLRGPPSLV